jgi:hypothetical protein
MKASELKVGTVVAAVNGTGKWDQKEERVTKVEVAQAPSGGYCEVKLLEDAKTGLGVRSWTSEGWKKAGETVRLKTRQLWMPWENFENRLRNMATAKEERESQLKAREDNLAELQRRIDQFAGEVDEPVRWAGRGYGHEPEQESHVRVSTEALKRVLDRAEGK